MTKAERIHEKLKGALAPEHLEVIDESHMHSVPKGAETHFKVIVVTSAFEGKALVARHQLVYRALADHMGAKGKEGVHALAITSRTPSEWAALPAGNESPKCAGGSKAETG